MTDEELAQLEERSCTGKKAWGAKRAREIAAEQTEKAGTLITAYRCIFCDGWHVGHPLSADGMRHLADAIRYKAQRSTAPVDEPTADPMREELERLRAALALMVDDQLLADDPTGEVPQIGGPSAYLFGFKRCQVLARRALDKEHAGG